MPKLNIHNKAGIKLEIKAGPKKGSNFDGTPKVLDVENNKSVCYDYSDECLVTAEPKMKNTGIKAANYVGKRGAKTKDIYVTGEDDRLTISDEEPD